MSETAKSPAKGFWSKAFGATFAFLLLAAVPALALPVLGADVFSSDPSSVEVSQSPLTFDAPATSLLKVTPVARGTQEASAQTDALVLAQWKNTDDLFDLLTQGNSTDTLTLILLLESIFTQQITLLETIFAQELALITALFTSFENTLLIILGKSPLS